MYDINLVHVSLKNKNIDSKYKPYIFFLHIAQLLFKLDLPCLLPLSSNNKSVDSNRSITYFSKIGLSVLFLNGILQFLCVFPSDCI